MLKKMSGFVFLQTLFAALLWAPVSGLADIAQRDGWRIVNTEYSFAELNERLDSAIAKSGMGLVTQASASAGASRRGLSILGNRVVGVYRNDFAVRMLEASVAAGIEAPIRFYVTENGEGAASLSYKTPTTVFAPYFGEGGEKLRELASALDAIFAEIAAEATE